jgi:hypothetical protein
LPVRLSLEGLDRILDQLKEEYTEAHARWVRSIIPELRDNRLFPTYTLPLVRSIYPNRSLWELLFREDDTSPRGRRSARMLGMTRADVESVYLLHVETGRGEDTEQPFVRVRVIFKLRDGHYRYCWWSAFPATMFSRRTAILTASAQARTLPRLVELLDPDDLPLSMTLALMARVAEAE